MLNNSKDVSKVYIQKMRLIQILVIIQTCRWSLGLIMDPICQSCLEIDSGLVSTYIHPSESVKLTRFKLPGFSEAYIIVDYRHLKQIPRINDEPIFKMFFQVIDSVTGVSTINEVNDTLIATNEYQIATTEELYLVVFVIVKDEIKEFEFLLRDSVGLRLSYSNNRIPTEDSSYVFVVQSEDVTFFLSKNINLPSNKPDLASMKSFYLENERNSSSFKSATTYAQSTTYWSTESKFVVPYFPYFSHCEGEGDLMMIMQMLQNSTDCSLVPIEETGWISEFSFGTSAMADRCLIKRKCMVEGEVEKNEYPGWLTLGKDLVLFTMTQSRISWRDYAYDMDFQPQDLVSCKINSSMGSNSSDMYPLKVKMTMGYYQVSQTQKKIISCLIEYDLYVASTSNFTYQLQIISYPLNHTYIMLNFGFKWYVYMIVFVIIGIIGNVENFLLWVYHYFVAEEKKQIKIKIYFRIIKEILKGTSMALVLCIAIIFIVSVVMNGKVFTTRFYNVDQDKAATPRVIFDYILQNPISNYDSTEMQKLRSGRMGLAFVAIGVMIILLMCKYFVGKEKKHEVYEDFSILGRKFKPIEWNRGKFVFGTFFYILLMYFFIYFAYSTLYSSNIWTFIVVMKVLQVIMQQITKGVYDDILPGLPLKIITDITAYLNTISAADLYDFLFGSLIDVAVTMIEKIYIFQVQNIIVDKIIEKSEELNRFYVNLMNEEDTEEESSRNQGRYQVAQNQQSNDGQQVFIVREVQEVQFFQQQIKQIYNFMKVEQEGRYLSLCTATPQQQKLKQKYFQSLQRSFKHQKQLLQSTSQQKPPSHQPNHQQQQQQQEQLQRQSAIFQLLLDHMAMIYSFLVNPFVVFMFWITYDQSYVLQAYGIVYNTVVLYILSALVIGIFSVINIIMIFHILESYMGFSFEEQINDMLARFDLRQKFWKSDQELSNFKLKPQNLGADHYCLSSQLFFILTVYVGGMILVLLGLAIMFKSNYNLFDDVGTVPVSIFWIGFLHIYIWIVKKLAKWVNVWDWKEFEEGRGKRNEMFNDDKEAMKQDEDMNDEESEDNRVRDYRKVEQQMQELSQFKTQNILFASLSQLPKLNKLFNLRKKSIRSNSSSSSSSIHPQSQQQQTTQLQKSKKEISESMKQKQHDSELPEEKDMNARKQLMDNREALRLSNQQEREKILLGQKRLETICSKLDLLWVREGFKLEYSLDNRDYIKENIEKILPLVQSLPQLQEYRHLQQTSNSYKGSEDKQNGRNGHHNQTGNKHLVNSSSKNNANNVTNMQNNQNKNMDPIVGEIILEWLRASQKAKAKRILNGLEEQSRLRKCAYCYQTWGLYYGGTTKLTPSLNTSNNVNSSVNHGNTPNTTANNMCLECSIRMATMSQTKVQNDQRRLSKSNKNKQGQRSNNSNILNVIKQEDLLEQQSSFNQIQEQEELKEARPQSKGIEGSRNRKRNQRKMHND